jgi:hypothetical protein
MLILPAVFATFDTLLASEASTLYEQSAAHKDATPVDVLKAVRGLHNLGNQYPEGSKERKQYHDKAEAIVKQYESTK